MCVCVCMYVCMRYSFFIMCQSFFQHRTKSRAKSQFSSGYICYICSDLSIAGCIGDKQRKRSDDCKGLDLALLASCNHTITSYGTYSFWASFLAGNGTGKRIIPQFNQKYRLPSQDSFQLKKHPFKSKLPRFYLGLDGFHWGQNQL